MKKLEITGKELNFADYLKHSQTLIETGTCSGRTVQKALELGYTKVISVEAWRPFFDSCCRIFRPQIVDKKVNLHFGQSTEVLPEMIAQSHGPAVFWLDAHPSGPGTAGHDDLMDKGNTSEYHQDTIISKELAIILATGHRHTIIIDDQNIESPAGQIAIDKIIAQVTATHADYKFYMMDERMGANYYSNKIIVCEPA